MSEPNSESTAVVVQEQPQRQRMIVHSPVAIMDSARFEHLGRVATVLAKAQVLPDSLTKERGEYLPFDVVQARAFLIASWADRNGQDPVMVGQETSFIHGRLMPSGKQVNAAIQHSLGYDFEPEYGAWDADKNQFIEGEPGTGERLAVRMAAVDETGKLIVNSKGVAKTVEGFVGGWKTVGREGKQTAWSNPAGWRRMLHNRAVREWTRTYRPGVILGTYTDEDRWESEEEFEAVTTVAPRSRKKDLKAQLAGPKEDGEGFDAAGIHATLNGEQPAAEEEKPADEKPEPEADPLANWKFRDDINGPAPRDVAYVLAGDVPTAAGRIATWKNGKPLADIGPKGAEQTGRYTMHPTEAAAPKDDDTFPGDKPSASAQDEPTYDDAEWTPLESSEGPAPRGVEYTLAGEEIGDDGAQVYEDGQPTRFADHRDFATLPEYEAHPEPLAEVEAELVEDAPPTFFDEVAKDTSWLTVKPKLVKVLKSDDFKALPEPDKEAFHASVWNWVHVNLKEGHRDPVDPAADVTAFRIWAAWIWKKGSGAEDAHAIEGTFRALKRQDAWKKTPAEAQERVAKAVEKFCNDLMKG